MAKLKNDSNKIVVANKFIEIGKSTKIRELKTKTNADKLKNERRISSTIKKVNTQYYVSSSCDELIGGTWSDIVQDSYDGYLWTRTKYEKTSGEVKYSSPSYQFKTEDVPETQILQIVCEKETYDRNDRISGNQTIVFKLTVKGYSVNTATVVATGSNGVVYKTVTDMESGSDSFYLPYLNCPDTITITATQSVSNIASTTITAINKTTEPMYLGELSELPNASSFPKVPSDYSYDYFLVGDYFSCVTTNSQDGITAGIPYEYNGTSWNAMNFTTRQDKSKAFTCLAGMLNSDVAIPSSTTLYAWIGTLVAQDASIARLFAQLIEVGNAIYGGNVNVNGTAGSRTSGSGFILDSNGILEFSDGYSKNMLADNIRLISSLNMYKNFDVQSGEAGADILHPSFSTTPAIKGDSTGISILTPSASGITTYDPTIPASKLTNTNTIITSGISGTFKGNSIAKMARITNASVVAIPSKTGSSGTITPTITGSVSSLTIYEATSTFTVPSDTHNYPTKTISVTANISNSWANTQTWGTVYGSATLTVNGTTIGSTNIPQSSDVPYSISVSGTASLGDTVTLKVQLSVFGFKSWSTMNVSWSTGSRSFSDVGMTTGLWLYSNSSWTRLGTSAVTESSNRLVVNTPFYYNSQYFVLPSTLFNYTSYTEDGTTYNIEAGRAYKATGKITINGTADVNINLLIRTPSHVMLYTDNGDYILDSGEQYYIYTQSNIKILGSTRGIAMEGCYPKRNYNDINGGFDCGTSGLMWDNGWFNDCNANHFTTLSTEEGKHNIYPYTEKAMDIINKTEVVSYTYKGDPNDVLNIGFIAERTPSEISGERHNRMVLDNCVGVLIKAVQELSAEIEELKNRT